MSMKAEITKLDPKDILLLIREWRICKVSS